MKAQLRGPGKIVQLPAVPRHRTTRLRSISTRLVALVALLVVSTVAVVVWQWTATERELIHRERRDAARGMANAVAHLAMNEIDDANWAQLRNNLELMVAETRDLLYVAIHGEAKKDIVAGVPIELSEQFVPDLVPLAVTRAAIVVREPLVTETFLLRNVMFRDELRAARGEPIVEVAAPVKIASGSKIGVVRVGVSVAAAERAASATQKKALAIGGLSLIIALAGALILARRLSRPIVQLAEDAAMIASGNLAHRADVDRTDEIGALAGAFNEMTSDLEGSFGRLRETLASFERFVPRKFLNVVAPEGIENIVVGTSTSRRITVLFTDLRGFTSISEELAPIDVFRLLNDYLARMGAAIDKAGGFVDKYIGDAIMALFDDEHTDGVLDAVVGMRAGLRAFNAEREKSGLRQIDAGIGIHGGDVVMGTIGFASKIESTVIGDPVNVASRVEGMTKDYKVAVLITGDVVARLSDRSRWRLREVAMAVNVRGRDEPIDLYTIDD